MQTQRRSLSYRPPTYEEAKTLSERKGGRFDGIFIDGVKFFKAKGGDNEARILPPTWENPRHYAYEIKLHRDIGPDKQSYLCLDQDGSPEMGKCPVCAERRELSRQRNIDQKELDALRPQTSNVIFLIDRNKPEEGPMVWMISIRTVNELIAQSLDKKRQIYLNIVDPIEGYDIEFTRTGEARNTKYTGFKVARAESPLSDNEDQLEEWLNYVDEHPIPEILKFYPSERISLVFRGDVEAGGDEGEDKKEEPIRHRSRSTNGHAEEEPRVTGKGNVPADSEEETHKPPFDTEGDKPQEKPEPEPEQRPRSRSRLDDAPKAAPKEAVATDSLKSRLAARLAARGKEAE